MGWRWMKTYNRIIFVGKSGTIREPMAKGILEDFTLNHPVEVQAKGLVVLFPEPINQKAEAILISNGIHMEGFTSVQFTEEDLTEDTLTLSVRRRSACLTCMAQTGKRTYRY
jgi:protein-tyrosine phosphatase